MKKHFQNKAWQYLVTSLALFSPEATIQCLLWAGCSAAFSLAGFISLVNSTSMQNDTAHELMPTSEL